MTRGHKGDGWKKLSVAMNAHIAGIEQAIMDRQPGTRSATVALAVRAFREALVDEQAAYPQRTQHFRDYGDHVIGQTVAGTTIWLTDDTEADLQALGAEFERRNLKQLLKATSGYNRKMLIYMALRWYAEQEVIESE